MDHWKEGEKFQKIGDIMKHNAPFLRMYTEYVKNFDHAMRAINTWYGKNSKFAAIMDNIHVSSTDIESNDISFSESHLVTSVTFSFTRRTIFRVYLKVDL